MTIAALFVDLSNFYSCLLKSDIEEPRFLRDYFLYWLDFDLLAKRLTESFSGIWVFYSGERIGPSDERIGGKYLKDYISRINALEGVTARDVNIPGEQRELVEYECENCGHKGVSESRSEKGVDASLTVHLFDTMDSWDVAYLLSGDADFVPAVASLRRRGKIVIGAGFSGASSALVRECYNYVDLGDSFVGEDVALYTIFKEDGVAEKWLTDEVRWEPRYSPSELVELTIWWRWGAGETFVVGLGPITLRSVFLTATGSIDLSDRQKLITDFQAKFADRVRVEEIRDGYRFTLSSSAWKSVERRLQKFSTSIEGLKFVKDPSGKEFYTIKYQYNDEKSRYELVMGAGSS